MSGPTPTDGFGGGSGTSGGGGGSSGSAGEGTGGNSGTGTAGLAGGVVTGIVAPVFLQDIARQAQAEPDRGRRFSYALAGVASFAIVIFAMIGVFGSNELPGWVGILIGPVMVGVWWLLVRGLRLLHSSGAGTTTDSSGDGQ